MPVDMYIFYTDDSREVYNIPLNMMHSVKKQEYNILQKNLPYWQWTQKEYSFEIPASLDHVKWIMIDASQRLGDVNYNNNVYPKQ
jgi:hypothetical protein